MMIKRSPTLSAVVMCILLGAGTAPWKALNMHVGSCTAKAQPQGTAYGDRERKALDLMDRIRRIVGDKQCIYQLSGRERRLLGETGEKLTRLGLRALPAYIEGLKNKNRYIREISVDDIGFIIQVRIPRPAGSERKDDIRGFLTSPEERQLLTATFHALAEALKDPDAIVRMGGACYISVFGEEAVPLLETALSDPAIGVRYEAWGALGMLGRYYGLIGTLTGKEPETFDDFVALLDDTTPYGVGESAAYKIQTRFAEQAVPVLLAMITSNRGQGRVRAMQTLSRMKVNEAIPPIVGVLRDATTNDTVLNAQYEAVYALRRMDTGEAIKGLAMGFGGQDPRIRICMGEVLTGYGRRETVVSEMVKLLKDGNPLIRAQAAELLCKNNEPAGIPALIDVLRIREFRGMASGALEKFTGRRFSHWSTWRAWWEKNKEVFVFSEEK